MISAALQPSSRIWGKTAARSAVRGAPGSLVPSAGLASAAKAKKKKKNKKAAEELTYAQQKVLAKERRRQTYEAKISRDTARQSRRDGSEDSVRGQHASAFRSWFDRYRTRNETMDRKARQAGLPWRVRVASVVERLPVILPDKEEWETDYEELDAYLKQFGRDYPKELGFRPGAPSTEGGESWVTNYDEILGELLNECLPVQINALCVRMYVV